MKSHKTLHLALANVKTSEIVIAQDISASGQKIFSKGATELESYYDELEKNTGTNV